MVSGRKEEELSVMEAVDNLSNMSEIDLKASMIEEDEGEFSTEINWRDPKQALRNEPAVKETFRVLHRYLQNMVRRDRTILDDPQTLKGIQAIMLLASEAVRKMDRFAALYPKEYKAISKLKEYTDLQKYYQQQVLGQRPQPKEIVEGWEEHLDENYEEIAGEAKGLKDLEAVRKDQSYELFFIKDENDRPYFSRSLLRHIRLLGNFDELIAKAEGEDPLLKLRELYDQELHEGAKDALQLASPYIDEFYKEGMKYKERPYEGSLNKAVMALRMAANPKNLIENQSFKSCLEYYADFHRFLRQALRAPRYQKRISGELGDTPYTHALLRLTHALCCFFFMRTEPKKETLKLIHEMIERGDELQGPRQKPKAEEKKLQLWTDLLDADESLRFLAKHYPNGPIMRTLDMFREEEEYEGYDPLMHENFPSQVFILSDKHLHVSVLRIPCPVQQIYINSADIVEEFLGFMRFLKEERKPDQHLLVNLQDRTSWKEYARCKALEDLAKTAEYTKTFHILGLPRDTSFFLQDEEYQTVEGAPVFMEQFEQQVLSGIDCGYLIPEPLRDKKLEKFVKESLKMVHEGFFDGSTNLSHSQRLSFIEIFYLLLTLKMIELLKVDSVSFTCKDAVDTGTQQTAIFYGFLKMVTNPKAWSKADKEQLLWILYTPALLVRERPINQAHLKRTISALETVHRQCIKNQKGIVKALEGIYKGIKFSELELD